MSTKDIKLGIITSYGIFAADMLTGVLFTPFLIRSLGQSEYGVYSLMGAFIAGLAVLDFGFGDAIVRYVAQYRAEQRKDKEMGLLTLCMAIYAAIATISLLAGVGFYGLLDVIYSGKLTVHELDTAKSIFLILLVNITFSFFIGAYHAYIQGYEKYAVLNGISFVRLIIRISALSVLLLLGYKSLAVVAVDTLLNVGMGSAYFLFAKRKLGMRMRLPAREEQSVSKPPRFSFDRTLLREITRYSSFVFIGNLADLLFWRIGLLVLGALSGSKAVAVYAVGTTLISYFQYISGVINGKLLPRVTQMVTQGAQGAVLTAFCVKIGRIQFMLLGGILLGYQLYGREFIHLWVGSDYALSWEIGLILMLAMLVQMIQYPNVMILRAMKKDGLRTMLQLVVMALGALLGTLLVRGYGVIGMTFGLALAIVLLNWIVVNIHYVKVFAYDFRQFFKQIGKLLPAMATAYGAGMLLNLIPGYAWSTWVAKCFAFLMLYVALLYLLGANPSEKAMLQSVKGVFQPLAKGFRRLGKVKV
ncbi:MAG: oligosaccharide flippase family protein [Gorillibacterium sp.]|nr:oligosaccharide flippase family protein [Gorillibacterium sp.]